MIPKQVGPSTAFWVTETGAVPPSDILTNQVGLRPRRLASMVIYSRQLVAQSSIDVEGLVRSDMALSMAQMLDSTAIFGNPAVDPNSPRGLFGYVGFPPDAVDPTDNINVFEFQPGTLTLYEAYIQFLMGLETRDIPMRSAAWIANPITWSGALATPKFVNTGFPILDPANMVLGYPYLRTNIMPATGPLALRLVLGDFAQMLLGSWVGFELIVDPFSLAHQAMVRAVANIFADLNVRYRKAFVLSGNAVDSPIPPPTPMPPPPLAAGQSEGPVKNAKK